MKNNDILKIKALVVFIFYCLKTHFTLFLLSLCPGYWCIAFPHLKYNPNRVIKEHSDD